MGPSPARLTRAQRPCLTPAKDRQGPMSTFRFSFSPRPAPASGSTVDWHEPWWLVESRSLGSSDAFAKPIYESMVLAGHTNH